MRLVQADRAVIQGDPLRAFISGHEMPADELERFRKVTIQREIRMRELKDRVEEREREIEKLRGK